MAYRRTVGAVSMVKAREWRNDERLKSAVSRLSEAILDGRISDKKALQFEKVLVMRDLKAPTIPTNSMILDHISTDSPEDLEEVQWLLMKKPTRTLSGVAVVAAMTSPYPCPHGKCIFCPGGVDGKDPTPQSYTGKEPAALRATQNFFDPFLQVKRRIEQLEEIGHPTDKIDLILMGGTITARSLEYQVWFVKGCLDGMNGKVSATFEESASLNEEGRHRCIGMTFETRPDWFQEQECDLLLDLGGTRIELGMQSAFDEVLTASGRGHTVEDTIEATRLAKDSGLKVGYHLMPGIPGSTTGDDIKTAEMVFTREDFMPDMIKIYPTLVIEGTRLYDMYMRGEYSPLSTEEAADLVARIKHLAPPWVRIQRVQRDIPIQLVEGGIRMSNLRQIAKDMMEKKGWSCRCIRCREIGHRLDGSAHVPKENDIELRRTDYRASGGLESFISFESRDLDALVGYARLRRPSKEAHRAEMEGAACIRELKVLGPMVPLGGKADREWQHRGYGKKMIKEAERIAREDWGLEWLLVTSGIGARDYYRKLGFERMGPFMGRAL